jgi:4-amino-4-deoxy-L-arabinose transferase-like glycosyltransferase
MVDLPIVGVLVLQHFISAGPAPSPGRMDLVPLIALAIAALAIGFEQIIQWQYGPMGIIAFVALSIGVKAKNTTISAIGAVILVMLLAQSG